MSQLLCVFIKVLQPLRGLTKRNTARASRNMGMCDPLVAQLVLVLPYWPMIPCQASGETSPFKFPFFTLVSICPSLGCAME